VKELENETVLKEMLHALKLHSEKIDEKLDDMKKEITDVRKEMKTEFANVRQEMNTEFANVRHEMNTEFANVRHEMNTEFANVNKKLDFSRERQDGGQAELMETKETIHFLHSKILQHDKLLHKLSHEQQ
jgi:chromosome segregation ATPase